MQRTAINHQLAMKPYQPLLLRILHGLTGLNAIAALLTAFWTYDTYDGRWGRIFLPRFEEIEGIHGTFGLFTLLIFPFFIIYAFRPGKRRLLQANSLTKLTAVGKPIWWYTLHQLTNTIMLVALTFALFSGKMMDEKWLPNGELNHNWYYAHLVSWLVLFFCIALHLLMSAKVGGSPLLMSMLHWQFREQDNPRKWREHILNWWENFRLISLADWLKSNFNVGEAIFLFSLVAAWIISLLK